MACEFALKHPESKLEGKKLAKQSIISKGSSRLRGPRRDTARTIETDCAISIGLKAINGAGAGHLTRYLSVVCELSRPQSTSAAARDDLDLILDDECAYIQLGTGGHTENAVLDKPLVASLNKLGDVKIVRDESPKSLPQHFFVGNVSATENCLNSKNHRAFEIDSFAAGYNSVFESIYSKIPAIFGPIQFTPADDQRSRTPDSSALGPCAVSDNSFQEDSNLLVEKSVFLTTFLDLVQNSISTMVQRLPPMNFSTLFLPTSFEKLKTI